jgi:hypothetical protein
MVSPTRLMTPIIPAPSIVTDENPGDGRVAGWAGGSVICGATGVPVTVDTGGDSVTRTS